MLLFLHKDKFISQNFKIHLFITLFNLFVYCVKIVETGFFAIFAIGF